MIVLMTVPMCVADWPTTTGAISPRIRRTAGCRKSIRGVARRPRLREPWDLEEQLSRPPRSTPTASPTTGSGSRGAITTAPMMIPMFSATGDRAGRRKWRWAFRTPIANADRPTRKRYGNMRRVMRTVSWPAAGSAKKPGAMTRTTHGAARMPRRDRPPRISSIIPVTTRSMRSVSARERVVTCSVKTGMKADDSAPSATSRRRRFGSRKATKKASVAAPAPKARAMTRSRRKPRIRLASVAALTTAAARATARRAVGTAGCGGGVSVSSTPIGRSALTGRPPGAPPSR